MKEKSIISNLRLKFAERSWNDTFQLVRRCMEKSRDESRPCAPLVRSLERLQEEFNVSSLNITKSRLEMIAKQQGMGFHVTEATCYLTADLFYLEVVLEQCGRVEEVKVAPQVGPPVSSESLLQLLRVKNYTDFSRKLAGLFAQYNMPGDNSDIKLKLFTSLQHLGKDLLQISVLQRAPNDRDSKIDLINSGRTGCVIEGKEDCPLIIQFYVTPTESDSQTADSKPVIHEAQVTVSASDVAHKLQMSSLIPQPPQLDPHGSPVFLLLKEVPHETQPACFVLKLQPFVPMTASFVKKLSLITDVTVPDVDLQWAPLPSLLVQGSQSANSHRETSDEQDTIYTVKFPDVSHSYILPRAAWQASAQIATVMSSVPFTHPAHVPAILELLRHQCVINTLLRSCVTGATPGPDCDLHFEVLPETDTSFSVTFNPPDTDSLAVLLVNISDSHQITCSLFGAGTGDATTDQYISTVITRCMSVPVTLRTLCSKLKELASTPRSPSRLATAEAENDHSAPSSAAVTDIDSTATKLSPGAAVAEDSSSVSGAACYAMSVADSELLT